MKLYAEGGKLGTAGRPPSIGARPPQPLCRGRPHPWRRRHPRPSTTHPTQRERSQKAPPPQSKSSPSPPSAGPRRDLVRPQRNRGSRPAGATGDCLRGDTDPSTPQGPVPVVGSPFPPEHPLTGQSRQLWEKIITTVCHIKPPGAALGLVSCLRTPLGSLLTAILPLRYVHISAYGITLVFVSSSATVCSGVPTGYSLCPNSSEVNPTAVVNFASV
ncbi:uncharacterized protein LOC144987092 [Oryzias latipes]